MRTAPKVARRCSTDPPGPRRNLPKGKAPREAGLFRTAGEPRDQPFGFSLAARALTTSKRFSSEPAMPTSVMYLPFTMTAGVPVIR